WKRSDELRDQILALGWEVRDTKDGQKLTPHGTLASGERTHLGILGSAGCQPASLGSLPRPGIGVTPNYVCKDVAGRVAGNYRLAACAPQKHAAREMHVLPEKCARNQSID